MSNLYTLITRSRKGSILKDNGLSSIIGGAEKKENTTDSVILNPEAVAKF
jgi:hypothetical protein